MTPTATPAPLDLASLDTKAPAERGIRIELRHPFTDAPLVDEQGDPYFVTALGLESGTIRTLQRKFNTARIEQASKQMARGGKRQPPPPDWDAIEGERFQTVAAQLVSPWYLPPMNGETLTFSADNALRVVSDPRFPWIAEQIEQETGDRRRFFSNSATS